MKTSDPTKAVTEALKKVQLLETEIPQLKKLTEESAGKLAELELNIDLADNNALAEVSRLQTIAALAPRRLSNLEEQLETGHESVLSECHALVVSEMGKHSRKLTELAQAKIKQQLRPYFSEDSQLDQAVEASSLMTQLSEIQSHIAVKHHLTTPGEIKNYARELVQAWGNLANFEKENLN